MPNLFRRSLLDGAPFTLPPAIDALSDRWRRARPRSRAVVVTTLVVSLLLVGVVRTVASPYGPPVHVLVAARALDVGERLTDEDLRVRRFPRDLAPANALRADEATRGRTLRAPLPTGAIATFAHIGEHGIADAVPSGMVGVAVDVDLLPRVSSGTRVDLVGREAVVLATGASVVAFNDGSVWFAVSPQDAPRVAAAAASATLAIVVHAAE